MGISDLEKLRIIALSGYECKTTRSKNARRFDRMLKIIESQIDSQKQSPDLKDS